MLRKLKTANYEEEVSGQDLDMLEVLLNWSRDKHPSSDDIKILFGWYFDRIDTDPDLKNIFRGFHFHWDGISEIVKDKKLTLYSSDFESWTTDVSTANTFAIGEIDKKRPGVILSRKVGPGDYLDVNLMVNWFEERGHRAYGSQMSECEIITDQYCDKCSLDDIECVIMDYQMYRYFTFLLGQNDWRYDKSYEPDSSWNFCILKKNKTMTPFYDFDDAVKNFDVKPTEDCT